MWRCNDCGYRGELEQFGVSYTRRTECPRCNSGDVCGSDDPALAVCDCSACRPLVASEGHLSAAEGVGLGLVGCCFVLVCGLLFGAAGCVQTERQAENNLRNLGRFSR